MKLSNNYIEFKNDSINKFFCNNERIKREKYFYLKFRNQKLNIPKLLSISKNKISFKKYKFTRVKSQKLFFNSLLKFLIKINKNINYKLFAKENLRSYQLLRKQVKNRFEKLSKQKIEKEYLPKIEEIKLYIKKILQENNGSTKLSHSRNIISQSDIGFHNCGVSGKKIFFYDFEYAGLDHPIKLICDTYYQPERKIDKKFILKFINDLEKNFKYKLPRNFFVFERLLKAKMMLIILNIFVISNINDVSMFMNKKIQKKIKLKRLNKAYKYIEVPFIYE